MAGGERSVRRLVMTQPRDVQIRAQVLEDVADELSKGAAGPTDYWFGQLAERLRHRAHRLRSGEVERL